MTSAADLLAAVGLATDGLALLGKPVAARGPGVYLVELAAPLATAPLELTTVGKWIERVPTLTLDGERPSSRALRARLQSFWIPSATVLFIGAAERTLAGRIRAASEQRLGDPRPLPAAQWLAALSVTGLRVRWAETAATEEYLDALLDAFGASVPDEERAALHDPTVVLPFANLRLATGERKGTGLAGSTLPLEREAPTPATHVVEVPAGDAEGARGEEHGTGVRRRTNAAPPPRPAARSAAARSSVSARSSRATRAAPPRAPAPEPVRLTADGLARLQAELEELTGVRRSEVIDRIRRARELGDLRENADYQAAREEQSFLEGRIQAIEGRLRNAVVVEEGDGVGDGTRPGRVGLGSRVVVDDGFDELAYTIVGPAESNPSAGRISDASPVGRALVGASAGDEVVVRTPRGEMRYRVVSVG
jgi:transcription elongation factor GreA